MITEILKTIGAKEEITFGDLFAGGGGVTTGALSLPNVKVLWALNHDEISIKTHEKNHPETKHYQADIRTQNEKELEEVDILWASLECTNHSNAKGGKPKDADSRTLANEMPRYVKHCNPSAVMIENVKEFLQWGPLDKDGHPIQERKGEDFDRWVCEMKSLGYPNCEWRMLNAADYGCHTRRERLFIIFTKNDISICWKEATHAEDENIFGMPLWKPVKECIDLNNYGRSIFGRKKPLSVNTQRRIAGGIKKFYPEMSFLIKYYGNGDSNGKPELNNKDIESPAGAITTSGKFQFITAYFNSSGNPESQNQSIDKPLNAIMTSNKYALISGFDFDIYMRFLNPIELAKITGFPAGYFSHEDLKLTWKSQVKMIGNAVPVGLASAVIEPMISVIENYKMQYVA